MKGHDNKEKNYCINVNTVIPDGNGGFEPCPKLMTEDELIRLLRIPQITNAANHKNVIDNLKRRHFLPRVHFCGKTLYPTREVLKWIESKCTT